MQTPNGATREDPAAILPADLEVAAAAGVGTVYSLRADHLVTQVVVTSGPVERVLGTWSFADADAQLDAMEQLGSAIMRRAIEEVRREIAVEADADLDGTYGGR